MKRVSTKLELRALATILDGKSSLRNSMLSGVRPDHFGHQSSVEVFERIHAYIRANRPIPSVRELGEDPALSKSARSFLKSGLSKRTARHPARLQRKNDVPSLIEKLDKYRHQRIFYEVAKDAADEIGKDNPDHSALYARMEEYLVSGRSSTGAEMYHAGAGGNEQAIFDSIVDDDAPLELIPTGFKTFDENTGGFARTNLVFLAANYGGGKSVAGMQLIINAYRMGYNVLWVSLEMDEHEAWERIWSNVSGIEHDLIRRRKLTSKQKRTLERARKDFYKHGKTRKCRLSTYHPGHIGPWELCSEIRGFNFDLVVVDYIGLMKPPPGTPNEERIQLGEVAKVLKITAGKRYLNCAMVVEAQLNDDNRLKYSRAMAEHANNVLWWRLDDRARERGEVVVHQDKARNSRLYDMFWKLDFERMTITDGGLAEDKGPIDRKGTRGKPPERDKHNKGRDSTTNKDKKTKRKSSKKGTKSRSNKRSVMPELTEF